MTAGPDRPDRTAADAFRAPSAAFRRGAPANTRDRHQGADHTVTGPVRAQRAPGPVGGDDGCALPGAVTDAFGGRAGDLGGGDRVVASPEHCAT